MECSHNIRVKKFSHPYNREMEKWTENIRFFFESSLNQSFDSVVSVKDRMLQKLLQKHKTLLNQ